MPEHSAYSPEVRERAIRIVQGHTPAQDLQWAAIRSTAAGQDGGLHRGPSPRSRSRAEIQRVWEAMRRRDGGKSVWRELPRNGRVDAG